MSREVMKNEEKRINHTLTEWTVEKFLDMRKELLDRQKDLEKSNLEMVEKLILSDEKFEKLSNELQSKLNEIVESLESEASSEIVEKTRLSDQKIEKLSKKLDSIQWKLNQTNNLSMDHQRKFNWTLRKLNEIDKILKPEILSRIDNLSMDHQEKFDWTLWKLNEIDKTLKPEVLSEMEKLTKEHQEKFDSIQSKLNEIDETLKPEASSEIVENIRLCNEKIEKLSKEHQEKMDSIQLKLNEIEKTLIPEVSSKMDKNYDSATSGKCFVLKHTFDNFSSFKNEENRFGEEEEHFGVPWQIRVKRNDGFLSFYLKNLLLQNTENKWEIEVKSEKKIVSSNSRGKKEKSGGKRFAVFKSDGIGSSRARREFIEWDELEKDFVVDDCFCVEIAVKIKKMTGIYKENLRSFDKTVEEYSDVVLIVNDEKFYVSKLILATDSPYFKNLFSVLSNETEKTEIKLSWIDSDDFQKYLEVLYGEQAIDEFTVEGILMVADMYDTPVVIEKCEYFLQNESKKTLKKKVQLSKRYNLPALEKQCFEGTE